MNNDIIKAVTVNITNCGPAADILINDHIFEIHSVHGAADEEKKGAYH
ncbi:hypothetical protein ES703_68424 [subsurface metagenome]